MFHVVYPYICIIGGVRCVLFLNVLYPLIRL
jgi:hypothetical protein